MRLLFPCLTLLIVSPSPDARAAGFEDNWVKTAPLRRIAPEGTVEARAFSRLVRIGNVAYTVGNVAFLRLPKPKDAAGSPAGAELGDWLRQAMGFEVIQARRAGDAWVFEQDWKAAARRLRVYVREVPGARGRDLLISTAIYRSGYADALGLETEILQRQLLGLGPSNVPWLRRLSAQAEVWIRSAHADDCGCDRSSVQYVQCVVACNRGTSPPIPQPPSGGGGTVFFPIGGLTDGAGASGTLDLLKYLPRINDTLTGIGDNLGKNATATQNVADAINTQGTQANATASRMATTLEQARQDSKAAMDRANATGERFADTAEKARLDARQLAERAMRMDNIFRSTLAATTGVLTANLMMSGVKLGVSKFLDLLTGAKKDESAQQLLRRFQDARVEYEKATAKVTQLENAIDRTIALSDWLKGEGLTTASAAALFGSLEVQSKEKADWLREEMRKDYSRLNSAASDVERRQLSHCIQVASQQVQFLEAAVRDLNDKILRIEQFKKDGVCAKIQENYELLGEAESLLQSARIRMMDTEFAAAEAKAGDYEGLLESARRATDWKRSVDEWKRAGRRDRELEKKTLALIDDKERQLVGQCSDVIQDGTRKRLAAQRKRLDPQGLDGICAILVKGQTQAEQPVTWSDLQGSLEDLGVESGEIQTIQGELEARKVIGHGTQFAQQRASVARGKANLDQASRSAKEAREETNSDAIPSLEAFSNDVLKHTNMMNDIRRRQGDLVNRLMGSLEKKGKLETACEAL